MIWYQQLVVFLFFLYYDERERKGRQETRDPFRLRSQQSRKPDSHKTVADMEDMMDNEFSQRLAMMRQGRGMTQQRLAEKLGVTAQAVSKYETGQSLPDVQTLKSLAGILGCTTDYLLGYELAEEDRVDMRERERADQIRAALQEESLTLCVGKDLVDMLIEEGKNQYENIHKLRVKLAKEYGILVPVIRMMDQLSLADKEYRILLFGRKVAGSGRLEYPMCFCPQERAERAEDIPGAEPVYGIDGVWRKKAQGDGAVENAGAKEPVTCMEIVTAHLEKIILENYGKIVNRQIISQMVEQVSKRYPAVTQGVVPERVSLARIQKTVTALVAEGIGVNRLDYIISFLEDHPEAEPMDGTEEFEELKAELK